MYVYVAQKANESLGAEGHWKVIFNLYMYIGVIGCWILLNVNIQCSAL